MIIIENKHGLGNKIKNLASAIYLARLIGDEVSEDWALKKFITSPRLGKDKSIPIIKVHTHKLETYRKDNAIVNLNLRHIVARSGNFVVMSHDHIDHQYENILQDYIEIYRDIFSEISISQRIMKIADEISKEVNISECTGVHVRSWHDHAFRNQVLYKSSNIWDIIKKENKKFFLCADHIDVEHEARKLGVNFFSLRKDTNERHICINKSEDAVSRALIDIILLSRCKRIVASYESTFSEVAWWLGGCQAEVLISEPKFIEVLRGNGILKRFPDKNFLLRGEEVNRLI